MYVVSVRRGQHHRKFLVNADDPMTAGAIMTALNRTETRMGERLFDTVDYVETVEFELDVMEI